MMVSLTTTSPTAASHRFVFFDSVSETHVIDVERDFSGCSSISANPNTVFIGDLTHNNDTHRDKTQFMIFVS